MRRRVMADVPDIGINKDVAPNGVYILHTNDKPYLLSDWNAFPDNINAVGVSVLTDNSRFVISPTQNSRIAWSNDKILVSGITTSDDRNIAKADYKGVQNTDAWIAYYGNAEDYAAGWCRNYTFKNGKKGYLGACGEWWDAYQNKAEVDACMSAISGSGLSTSIYWTSTQMHQDAAWLLQWSYGDISGIIYKDGLGLARAFCEL